MKLVRPPLQAPGVYVQEVPSGGDAITGVPTSVTAFVGRTKWGPVETATLVTSYAEFTTNFGGPTADGYLASCVEDYFLNGGVQAIVVRLFNPVEEARDTTDVASCTGTVALTGASIATLAAASPGTWAERLVAAVDHDGLLDDNGDLLTSVVQAYTTGGWTPGGPDDLFNLTLTFSDAGRTVLSERFVGVTPSAGGGARQLSRVLEQQSRLARVVDPTRTYSTTSGADGSPLQDYGPAKAVLETVEILNLLCVPPDTTLGDGDTLGPWLPSAYALFAALAEERRAMLIVDTPPSWSDASHDRATMTAEEFTYALGVTAGDPTARYAAAYFPWLQKADPLDGNAPRPVPPCGAIAGIMARTDQSRGVWKAPAGLEAGILGITGLSYTLTEVETANLNEIGLNCLRSFSSTGPVVWGARTLMGSDALSDDFKYVPIRRLANYMEESLLRGTRWAVFEPNAEPLWAQVRLSVGTFMADLFRQGAFQGTSAKDAYSVTCDATVNSQSDIDSGILNVVVMYAPLKPAEFMVLYFQQQTLGG